MKPIHILLVEDNEGDILLTTEALSEGKVSNTISIVKDGWEAMQYLERNEKYRNELPPDLILLDVNLPKMNGHEVLKQIKSNDSLKHIPVIMLTTSSSEKDIWSSYQNYVNCYITKPVEVDDFINVVASIENFWISIVQLPTKIKS
jgi:CheY-like chemotaxis protein